jgi:hypothetical protein
VAAASREGRAGTSLSVQQFAQSICRDSSLLPLIFLIISRPADRLTD